MNSILLLLSIACSAQNSQTLPMSSLDQKGAQQAIQQALNNTFSISGGTIANGGGITLSSVTFQDGTKLNSAATLVTNGGTSGVSGKTAYWTGATTIGSGPAIVTSSSITFPNGSGFLSDVGSTATFAAIGDFQLGSSTASLSNVLPRSNLVGAWAVFVGSGSNNTSAQIFSSYNVASVNHFGTGVYQVNFGKAFSSNVSYACTCNTMDTGAANSCALESDGSNLVPKTVNNIEIITGNSASGQKNVNRIHIVCIGFQ